MRNLLVRFVCLAALLASAAWPLRAESSSAKPVAIGVTVGAVIDNRTPESMISGCHVMLSLSGDAVADAQEVRRIRVTNARDELGRDLIKPVDPSAGTGERGVTSFPTPAEEQRRLDAVAGEVARRRAMREGQPVTSAPVAMPPLATRTLSKSTPSIALRNPSRQSATIKIIEGEIELFSPTEANGGILRIDRPFATPAAFTANETLQASAIQLMFLSADTFAADREAAGSPATGPWTEEIATQFKGFSALPAATRRQLAFFFLNDPNRLVVDLELRSADGRRLDRGGFRSGLPQLRGLNFDGALPAGTQLIVRLATPGAVTSYPFKLENIPLP